MPGLAGQDFIIKTPAAESVANGAAKPQDSAFTALGNVQTLSKEFTATEIEITSQSSNNNRELLEEAGIKQMTLSVEGYVPDSTLFRSLETNMLNQKLRWFQVSRPDNSGRTYTGKFKITSLSDTGGVGDAVTFSLSLMSSGAVTIS